MSNVRALTIDELDVVSGGETPTTITMDLGFATISVTSDKNCYGYAVDFGGGDIRGGKGCTK
jgi:hypothetical protein